MTRADFPAAMFSFAPCGFGVDLFTRRFGVLLPSFGLLSAQIWAARSFFLGVGTPRCLVVESASFWSWHPFFWVVSKGHQEESTDAMGHFLGAP